MVSLSDDLVMARGQPGFPIVSCKPIGKIPTSPQVSVMAAAPFLYNLSVPRGTRVLLPCFLMRSPPLWATSSVPLWPASFAHVTPSPSRSNAKRYFVSNLFYLLERPFDCLKVIGPPRRMFFFS